MSAAFAPSPWLAWVKAKRTTSQTARGFSPGRPPRNANTRASGKASATATSFAVGGGASAGKAGTGLNHSPLLPSAGWARKCGTATEASTMSPPVSSYSTTPPRAIGEPRPDPEVLNLVDGLRAGEPATGSTGQQQRGAAGARVSRRYLCMVPVAASAPGTGGETRRGHESQAGRLRDSPGSAIALDRSLAKRLMQPFDQRDACASESASNVGGDSSSAGTEDARKLRAACLAISTRKQQPAYGFEGLRLYPPSRV